MQSVAIGFAPTAATATATPAASATSSAVSAATSAGPRRTILARTSFIDGQSTSIDIFAVQGLDGGLGALLGFHGDKGKSAWLPAEFVHDHIDLGDGAVSGEKILELVLGGVEGKISYKQFSTHDDFLT